MQSHFLCLRTLFSMFYFVLFSTISYFSISSILLLFSGVYSTIVVTYLLTVGPGLRKRLVRRDDADYLQHWCRHRLLPIHTVRRPVRTEESALLLSLWHGCIRHRTRVLARCHRLLCLSVHHRHVRRGEFLTHQIFFVVIFIQTR